MKMRKLTGWTRWPVGERNSDTYLHEVACFFKWINTLTQKCNEFVHKSGFLFHLHRHYGYVRNEVLWYLDILAWRYQSTSYCDFKPRLWQSFNDHYYFLPTYTFLKISTCMLIPTILLSLFFKCTFVFLTFYIFCQTFVELKKVEDVFNPLHNSILWILGWFDKH